MSLNRVRVFSVGVSIPPYFGILTIADLFSLTQNYLMADFVLFIDLIVFLEYILSIIYSEIFGNGHIETCLLGIVIAVALYSESLVIIGNKNRWSFDEELISNVKPIMTDKWCLSCLHVPVIES